MELSTHEKLRLRRQYGQWAVITGATSGIGAELARLLASSNLDILIVGRNSDTLEATKSTLKNGSGVEVRSIVADLTTPAAVERVIVASEELDVGLFVGSAGFGTSGSFVDSEIAMEIEMLRVNCEAILALTHNFANRFVRQKRGGIVLLSSLLGFHGVPFAANYAATKAFVQCLAEALAMEVKPLGVDVLAAAPGPVDSGFAERANMNLGMSAKPTQIGVPILEALGRRRMVLPGTLSKLLRYALITVPRSAKIRIMANVMEKFTAHQGRTKSITGE